MEDGHFKNYIVSYKVVDKKNALYFLEVPMGRGGVAVVVRV